MQLLEGWLCQLSKVKILLLGFFIYRVYIIGCWVFFEGGGWHISSEGCRFNCPISYPADVICFISQHSKTNTIMNINTLQTYLHRKHSCLLMIWMKDFLFLFFSWKCIFSFSLYKLTFKPGCDNKGSKVFNVLVVCPMLKIQFSKCKTLNMICTSLLKFPHCIIKSRLDCKDKIIL